MHNSSTYLSLLVAYVQLSCADGTPLASVSAADLKRYLSGWGNLMLLATSATHEPIDIRTCCSIAGITLSEFFDIAEAYTEREKIIDVLPICARFAFKIAKARYYDEHPDEKPIKPGSQMLRAAAKGVKDDAKPHLSNCAHGN